MEMIKILLRFDTERLVYCYEYFLRKHKKDTN